MLLNRRFPDSFKTLVQMAHARIKEEHNLDLLISSQVSTQFARTRSMEFNHAYLSFLFLSFFPKNQTPTFHEEPCCCRITQSISDRISLNRLRKMNEPRRNREPIQIFRSITIYYSLNDSVEKNNFPFILVLRSSSLKTLIIN